MLNIPRPDNSLGMDARAEVIGVWSPETHHVMLVISKHLSSAKYLLTDDPTVRCSFHVVDGSV